MPSGRYRFTRGNSVNAFFSKNRPSTDALNAINSWKSDQSNRNCTVLLDEDEQLLAELSWSENDDTVGSVLEVACNEFGVVHAYEQT